MNEHAEQIAKAATAAAYSVSGGLVISDWLQFLNTNASACGVIIGFMTFIINWYFQIVNSRAIKGRCNDE